MKILFLMIITSLVMIIAKKLFFGLLVDSKTIKKNYLNQDIPIGFGMLFPIASICSLTILHLFYPLDSIAYIFILGLTSISFLGVLDDLLGNRETSGLKGHIGKLLKLELTTGGLKAIMGMVIGIFVTMPFENNFIPLLLKASIIALFTNCINLLDLRPGRAIKGYLIYSFVVVLLFFRQQSIYLLVMITIIVICYFPLDIKAKAMMGDAGSNALGFTLGFFTVLYANFIMNLLVFLFLIIIHIIAEKSSITKIIEGNRILRFLDQLGR